MTLNDLLRAQGLHPAQVLVLRHRPHEPELNRALPWLAAERPEVFNAYQQTQGPKLEAVMEALRGTGLVASCIGTEAGKGLFIGLYRIAGSRTMTYDEYWRVPANRDMKQLGMQGFTKESGRASILWFDMVLTDFYSHWKGKLVLGWPPPERSWWRRAHRNEFPVAAVLSESALDATMPGWEDLCLSWEALRVLPGRWQAALSQWRGIYYIFDESDGKGYVGAAYGATNILGRWLNYAGAGHGGNRLLRARHPKNFQFTILQRVSPDMEAADVIRLEGTWKERLHTRAPFGLNDN